MRNSWYTCTKYLILEQKTVRRFNALWILSGTSLVVIKFNKLAGLKWESQTKLINGELKMYELKVPYQLSPQVITKKRQYI